MLGCSTLLVPEPGLTRSAPNARTAAQSSAEACLNAMLRDHLSFQSMIPVDRALINQLHAMDNSQYCSSNSFPDCCNRSRTPLAIVNCHSSTRRPKMPSMKRSISVHPVAYSQKPPLRERIFTALTSNKAALMFNFQTAARSNPVQRTPFTATTTKMIVKRGSPR